MAVKIEFNEAVELLKRAVEERGSDYVYRDDPKAVDRDEDSPDRVRCVNTFDDGTPGCIVGQVCFYKGLTADDLHPFRYSPVDTLVDPHASLLDIDAATLDLLAEAQSEQDRGETWGAAVARAIQNAGYRSYGS